MDFPLVTRARLEALERELQSQLERERGLLREAAQDAARWRDQAAKARLEVADQAKKLEELEAARAELDRRHAFLGCLVTWLVRKNGSCVRPTVADLEEVAAGWGFRIVEDNAFRRGPGYRIETGRLVKPDPEKTHEGNGKATPAEASAGAPPAPPPEPALAPPAQEEAPELPRLRILPPEPGGGEGTP